MSPSDRPAPESRPIEPEPAASAADGSPSPPGRRGVPVIIKAVTAVLLVTGMGAAVWFLGRRAWNDYRDYRDSWLAAEDSAPVGYIGANYRRSYHDKPVVFRHQEQGRTKLWAAKQEDGQPEFWDVTDADIVV